MFWPSYVMFGSSSGRINLEHCRPPQRKRNRKSTRQSKNVTAAPVAIEINTRTFGEVISCFPYEDELHLVGSNARVTVFQPTGIVGIKQIEYVVFVIRPKQCHLLCFHLKKSTVSSPEGILHLKPISPAQQLE